MVPGSPTLTSRLKERRIAAGVPQRALAAEVGVSRQTLTAIETGTSAPSTTIALALARALRCRVEDLFQLGEGQRPLAVTLVAATRAPAARVALARVEHRWVAHPLGDEAAGFAEPADGLLAPRPRGRAALVHPLRDGEALGQNLFAAGCDPALALLAAHLGERTPVGRLHWLEAGSGRALELLAAGEVHLAGLHLYDEATGEHNVAPVRRQLAGRAAVLVNLATWEQGLVVAAGNPRKLRGVADLARKGLRRVRREPGSGAEQLLLRLAAAAGVPVRALAPVAVARGHMAVARLVATGAADAGIATRAAAACHGLDFVALGEARFDLAVPAAATGDARIARLLDVLADARFRRDLGGLHGYGNRRTGHVVAEIAA